MKAPDEHTPDLSSLPRLRAQLDHAHGYATNTHKLILKTLANRPTLWHTNLEDLECAANFAELTALRIREAQKAADAISLPTHPHTSR